MTRHLSHFNQMMRYTQLYYACCTKFHAHVQKHARMDIHMQTLIVTHTHTASKTRSTRTHTHTSVFFKATCRFSSICVAFWQVLTHLCSPGYPGHTALNFLLVNAGQFMVVNARHFWSIFAGQCWSFWVNFCWSVLVLVNAGQFLLVSAGHFGSIFAGQCWSFWVKLWWSMLVIFGQFLLVNAGPFLLVILGQFLLANAGHVAQNFCAVQLFGWSPGDQGSSPSKLFAHLLSPPLLVTSGLAFWVQNPKVPCAEPFSIFMVLRGYMYRTKHRNGICRITLFQRFIWGHFVQQLIFGEGSATQHFSLSTLRSNLGFQCYKTSKKIEGGD